IEVDEGLGVVGPGRADPPPGGLFGCTGDGDGDGDGDGVGGEAVGGVVGDVVGELGPVGPVGGAVVVGAALLGGLNGAEGTDVVVGAVADVVGVVEVVEEVVGVVVVVVVVGPGAGATVSVNVSMASDGTPLVASRLIGQLPAEPVAGVPAIVAVPSPLSVKVTPGGRAPVSVLKACPLPVVVTVKDPGEPTVKVADEGLVKLGGKSGVMTAWAAEANSAVVTVGEIPVDST
ncbi:MAG: hypothetical protein KGQ66_00610, partial [Acidobacteriota bacterium]|nr:hypothetical protein [Acidobacteriota bacterium]